MCSTTAVIVQEENERNYLVFKLAYKLASKGTKCLIVTKPIHRSGFQKIINERHSLHPEILELIQYRYPPQCQYPIEEPVHEMLLGLRHFASTAAFINWCHGFQTGQVMPHALFINGFEDFCDPSDFAAYYFCACLVDTATHFAKSLTERSLIVDFHLISAFNETTRENRPAFFDMFSSILTAEEVANEFNLTMI